jgi:hypothetical protein
MVVVYTRVLQSRYFDLSRSLSLALVVGVVGLRNQDGTTTVTLSFILSSTVRCVQQTRDIERLE